MSQNSSLKRIATCPLLFSLKTLCLAALYTFSAGDAKSQSSTSWIQLADSNNVTVHYKTAVCNSQEVVLFRFVNNNSTSVNINWTFYGLGPDSMFTIGASATETGSCIGSNTLVFKVMPGLNIGSNPPFRFTQLTIN